MSEWCKDDLIRNKELSGVERRGEIRGGRSGFIVWEKMFALIHSDRGYFVLVRYFMATLYHVHLA